jgi:hypothetical protein
LLVAAAAAGVVWFGGAAARPKAPRPELPRPPAPSLRVQLTEGGEMTEVVVDGARMRVSSTAGERRFERVLSDEERERLSSAARRAVASEDQRFLCGEREVYLSATVDGRTAATALCPSSGRWFAAWRDLLDAVRAVARPQRAAP